jgi:hypothetical protein
MTHYKTILGELQSYINSISSNKLTNKHLIKLINNLRIELENCGDDCSPETVADISTRVNNVKKLIYLQSDSVKHIEKLDELDESNSDSASNAHPNNIVQTIKFEQEAVARKAEIKRRDVEAAALETQSRLVKSEAVESNLVELDSGSDSDSDSDDEADKDIIELLNVKSACINKTGDKNKCDNIYAENLKNRMDELQSVFESYKSITPENIAKLKERKSQIFELAESLRPTSFIGGLNAQQDMKKIKELKADIQQQESEMEIQQNIQQIKQIDTEIRDMLESKNLADILPKYAKKETIEDLIRYYDRIIIKMKKREYLQSITQQKRPAAVPYKRADIKVDNIKANQSGGNTSYTLTKLITKKYLRITLLIVCIMLLLVLLYTVYYDYNLFNFGNFANFANPLT